ncbi:MULTISPECIES: ferrous iron transport protein B [Dialister]|jgi:ferrous iron transport protein B|uniref:Ferrous iron transport protein B n=2 Tax=Dialister TaxID=39948 RepID=A0A8D5A517_9FIRM|nr:MULTISPECIES: ferrous iron transport protein B [Dialister]MBS6413178.1 ferrous iron transport protein B [Dialister sp.]UYJ17168.1 MAG: ferrous iron transport protein B [Veillonellaceae bacterium]BBK24115.1 ferrous iron transport protein B [Dialister hominis]
MSIRIALAGNPNCGKTTLFNELTGSNQYVGNWAGVTVEKKDGILKGHKDVIIQDLPGIYSLSPYTLEEKVARNYLVNEQPDVILNIIDGTNLERNLYLSTQLIEIGLPVVMAVNMMDLVKKSGDKIDIKKMGEELGCEVVEISALQGKGCKEAAERAIEAAKSGRKHCLPSVFTGSVEHAIAHIEESIHDKVDKEFVRWYAIKVFERDHDATDALQLDPKTLAHLDTHIKDCEDEMDDDSESIIINQRYSYIGRIISSVLTKKHDCHAMTVSDKIDRVVTNRILALPIFFAIMTFVYYISVTTIGTWATDWTNDVFFGEYVNDAAAGLMEAIAAPDWLESLVVDGIIGGVGTVLGFVPQIVLIFFFLALLEDSGYMARVAFIMDRIFRKFGLSGKSFIPILVGSGCGVPAVMATRTIEDQRDRRMTIMLCTFIPCSAKAVIISMITSTFFPDSVLMAPAMYFLGIAVIVLAGIALKKTSAFAGDPAPFVMELPAYHIPAMKGVIRHMWDRAKGFIIKAGTIIFAACVIIWFFSAFNASMEMVDIEDSMLAAFGGAISWIFAPVGLGDWKGAVAVISAEMAKENAIGTLAVLNGVAADAEDMELMAGIAGMFTPIAAFSFMILNLFDPPCVVAMATIAREMGDRKWAALAIGFQIMLGYGMAFVAYNIGSWLFYGAAFGIGQVLAIVVSLAALWMIVRPAPKKKEEILEGAGVKA